MDSALTPEQPASRPQPVRPTRVPDPSSFSGASSRSPAAAAGRAYGSPGVTIGRFLARRARMGVVLVAQALGFALIYLGAFALRYDGAVPALAWKLACATLPLVLSVKLLAVLATSCHRGWWRYATFADLVNVVQAATVGSAALVLVDSLQGNALFVPPSILLIDWAGVLLVLCGSRAATRLGREFGPLWLPGKNKVQQRVLVVGAGEAGEALVRKIRVSSRLGMRVVGFLDDDPRTHGHNLAGLPVLGSLEDVQPISRRHKVATVLVAARALPAGTIRALVESAGTMGVKVQVVPELDALISGGLTVQPRDVDIQDLLCRAPVQLDTQSLESFLEGRVVLVTGASGSIGSEICRQVLAYRPARIVVVDHNENGIFYLERELKPRAGACEVIPFVASITDGARLRTAFSRYRPEVVLHAAAHKHVPMMEGNPGEAIKNNVFGTRTLVEEALRWNVESVVMISTDKAVNPTSVMGSSKRLAEMVVQSLAGLTTTRLITVRFGNVLGSTGSVVPIFKEQIRNGGPVTVTHPDMTRFFMTIPEAAQLVLQAGAFGKSGDIFVLDMGEPVKVVDMARDLIRLSGLVEGREIDLVFTGLRPGEKLYEELYNDAETRLSTPHPKIFRARHRETCSHELWEALGRLAAAMDGPPEEVITALQAAIPEYRPNRQGAAPVVATPAPAPALAPASVPAPVPGGSREIIRHHTEKPHRPHTAVGHPAACDVTAS